MSTFDQHANFVSSAIAVTPTPQLSGTQFTVLTGTGAAFPIPPFNCIVFPSNVFPNYLNTEIVRVTGISGDIFTVTRRTENSNARTIMIGDQIALTVTAKTLTDIETATTASPIDSIITINNNNLGVNNLYPRYPVDVNGNVNITGSLIQSSDIAVSSTGMLGGSVSNVRISANKGLQFFNSTTGLWHVLTCTGSSPQIGWDAGDPSIAQSLPIAFDNYGVLAGTHGTIRIKTGVGLQWFNLVTGFWYTLICYGNWNQLGWDAPDSSASVLNTVILDNTGVLGGGSGNVRIKIGTGLQWLNASTNFWHTLLCINNPPTFAWDQNDSSASQLGVTVLGTGAVLGGNNGNVRVKTNKGLQWYNNDTGLWHTMVCHGNPPQTGWDAGDAN